MRKNKQIKCQAAQENLSKSLGMSHVWILIYHISFYEDDINNPVGVFHLKRKQKCKHQHNKHRMKHCNIIYTRITVKKKRRLYCMGPSKERKHRASYQFGMRRPGVWLFSVTPYQRGSVCSAALNAIVSIFERSTGRLCRLFGTP